MEKYNIGEFTRLYRRTLKGQGETGATVWLKLSRIKPRIIRVLSIVSVENTTNAFDKCRLGISNLGQLHYIDEIQTIAADELIVCKSVINLGESDILFAELTGTTTDDIVIMTCVGWEIDK